MMNFENTELDSILNEMCLNSVIDISDVPNIDLYIDQVTTFIEDNLSSYKRTAEDKVLTKTMINNYTKDKVLPPPEKKKYSKEHVLLLILIYYMKPIISLSDINIVLNSSKYTDVSQLYKNFAKLQEMESSSLKEYVKEAAEKISAVSEGVEIGNDSLLLLILSLIIEAGMKKRLAEKIIDKFLGSEKK